MTTSQASLISLKRELSLRAKELLFVATVQTMFVKVLQSWLTRALMFLSQATQLTQLVSSILLQVHIRSGLLKMARSISPLHQAAAQVVHFTQITWVQVLLPMVLQTLWVVCTVMLSLPVLHQFLLTLR